MNRRTVGWMAFAFVLLGSGVALTVITYQSYRQDLEAARARVSEGSRIAKTRCGPIEYADIGGGPPVLMVHGAGGGFDQGLSVAKPLIDDGYRVIAPSRFGYLRTPLPADSSPAAQADAHACLLDALNIHRAAVMADSAGAPSAMQFCLRHPRRCRAMVLAVPLSYAPAWSRGRTRESSSVSRLVTEAVPRSDFLFWAAMRLAPTVLVESVLATPPEDFRQASADERKRVLGMLRGILPVSERRLGLLNDSSIAAALSRYELERIQVPTLVMGVEDDLFQTYPGARYTARKIPGARFLGFERGGHLWVGHQRSFWAEARDFFQGLQ